MNIVNYSNTINIFNIIIETCFLDGGLAKKIFSLTFAAPLREDSVAQLVEQLPFKQWVPGSSPGRITD